MLNATPSPDRAGAPDFPPEPINATLAAHRGRLRLKDAFTLYLAHFEGNDPSRRRALAWWQDRLGECLAHEVDEDTIADLLEEFRTSPCKRYLRTRGGGSCRDLARTRAPATVNRLKSHLSAVLNWCRRRRMMPRGWVNPCHAIPHEAEDNARVRFLSVSERAALFAACKTAVWPKMYLLALTALVTGARRGELLALRYEDVNLDTGQAYVRTSKNGDPRVLILTPQVIEEFRAVCKPVPGALVFASPRNPDKPMQIDQNFKRVLERANIQNFRFHDLRHSCASYLAQSGASVLEIAHVLGHKDLKMTQRYAHLCTQSKSALVFRVMGQMA